MVAKEGVRGLREVVRAEGQSHRCRCRGTQEGQITRGEGETARENSNAAAQG